MNLKKQSTPLLKETTSQELLTLTYIGWYAIALDYDVFIEKAGILPRGWIHPAVKNPCIGQFLSAMRVQWDKISNVKLSTFLSMKYY